MAEREYSETRKIMKIGKRIEIKGIVQGVGFRPFVYNLADKYALNGWIKNTSKGVFIEVDGEEKTINSFIQSIVDSPPPLAQIDSVSTTEIQPNGFKKFEIIKSEPIEGEFIPISPDISICDDCLTELFDPKDQRYRYPFINCTNCGPRFSIIRDIPYDRPLTTMQPFPMCEYCEQEYEDPSNRRFHAQPVACPDCGPQIWLQVNGKTISKREEALQQARDLLEQGKILAIKGLGGFHLACDATNDAAVQELRNRKRRSLKPFALMVNDLETAQKYCEYNEAQLSLLSSKERPIALAEKKENTNLSQNIAPGNNRIGLMLPYTPLHYLLLEPAEEYPDVLVMTSGNISEEPIAYTNPDGINRLNTLADAFLMHDRAIHMRIDDSVTSIFREKPYFSRRARGYAPRPIRFDTDFSPVLAVGAELKNSFCLSKAEYAFMSHHIGDLENAESLQSFEEAIIHYQNLFRVEPEAITCDLHPDYLASQYASERACKQEIPLYQIQHHHAHLASCMADNGLLDDREVIGAIFDGTGLGTDNSIWGGEFLVGGLAGFERKFHLKECPLPGGDTATRNPARIALAQLWNSNIPWTSDLAPMKHFSTEQLSILQQQLDARINTPLTTSMGRLFDAAASLLGIRHAISYEAQAAIEMEALCAQNEDGIYDFLIEGSSIDPTPLWKSMLEEINEGIQKEIIAARFHNSVVSLVLTIANQIKRDTGLLTIALSGGVWQNMYLLTKSVTVLELAGFEVLWHRSVPTNDGGIALGQMMIAQEIIKKGITR